MMDDTMFLNSPRKIFWAGLICVTLGMVLPFLIVMKVIENTLALSFFIYILQFIGMVLGVIAAAGLAIERRHKEKQDKEKTKTDDQESTTGWMK